jgi:hypothetical protein
LQEEDDEIKERNVHVIGLCIFKNSMLLLGSEIRPIVDSKGSFAWGKLGGVDAFMMCLDESKLPLRAGPELPAFHDVNCEKLRLAIGWEAKIIFSERTCMECCINACELESNLQQRGDSMHKHKNLHADYCFLLTSLLLLSQRER